MKALIPILFLLFASSSVMMAQNKTEINSTEVTKLLNQNKKIVVLDVRTAGEFNDGHIKGALNLDVHQPDFNAQIDKLDKNKTYLVYCRTHNRSGVAVNYMLENGFTKIYQMMDGFTGWAYNNLPMEK